MSNLFYHYNKLSEILQKIITSQSEDISLLIKEISDIQNDSKTLLDKLTICLNLEQQQRELIDFYKIQNRNSYIYGNVVTTLPGLIIIGAGAIELYSGDSTKGLNLIKAGGITLVSMEIVYQGGHWFFKCW